MTFNKNKKNKLKSSILLLAPFVLLASNEVINAQELTQDPDTSQITQDLTEPIVTPTEEIVETPSQTTDQNVNPAEIIDSTDLTQPQDPAPYTQRDDLIISQIINGNSNNKAIELFNPTPSEIDLAQYTIELYTNGKTNIQSSLNLSGNLPSYDYYTIAHSQANNIKDKADLVHGGVTSYNGDDAIVLKKADNVVDSFGQIGNRSNWNKNITIVRNNTAQADTDPTDTFTISDWTKTSNRNDFSYLDIDHQKLDGSADQTNQSSNSTTGTANQGSTSQTLTENVQTENTQTEQLPLTPINQIQGPGHWSPMEGQKVRVNGVVTNKYPLGNSTYLHVQEKDENIDNDPKTSEALVVYLGGTKYLTPEEEAVTIGDYIEVIGQVSEYQIEGFYNSKKNTDLPVTQINARNDKGGSIKVLEKDVKLPEPIPLQSIPTEVISTEGFVEFDPDKYAIDYWESLEAMRVKVDYDLRSVAPQQHGNLWVIDKSTPAETYRGGVLLKENDVNTNKFAIKPMPNRYNNGNNGRNLDVITGDTIRASQDDPIIGTVMYDFSNYLVYTDINDIKPRIDTSERIEPQGTSITPDENKLTIASFNLENYSNNRGNKETSDEKSNLIATAIGVHLKSPDIVGVTEVQDNDGSSSGGPEADQSYQRLIDDIERVSGTKYDYLNIDPVKNQDGGKPNSNIRVGFLYRPDRVSVSKNPGGSTDSVSYQNGKLTFNPGRINPTSQAFTNSRKPLVAEFDFNGNQVLVIVNHWNSKRGDDAIYGKNQPVQLKSQDRRVKMAQEVTSFIDQVKADNPDAYIVSVGDFNDFQWTDSLKTHEGSHMYNMTNTLPEDKRYTYIYHGNSQVLDHILVSNNLKDKTVMDAVKLNADFTTMSNRSSDHDPVMIQIDFTPVENLTENPEEVPQDDQTGSTSEVTKDSDQTEEQPADSQDTQKLSDQTEKASDIDTKTGEGDETSQSDEEKVNAEESAGGTDSTNQTEESPAGIQDNQKVSDQSEKTSDVETKSGEDEKASSQTPADSVTKDDAQKSGDQAEKFSDTDTKTGEGGETPASDVEKTSIEKTAGAIDSANQTEESQAGIQDNQKVSDQSEKTSDAETKSSEDEKTSSQTPADSVTKDDAQKSGDQAEKFSDTDTKTEEGDKTPASDVEKTNAEELAGSTDSANQTEETPADTQKLSDQTEKASGTDTKTGEGGETPVSDVEKTNAEELAGSTDSANQTEETSADTQKLSDQAEKVLSTDTKTSEGDETSQSDEEKLNAEESAGGTDSTDAQDVKKDSDQSEKASSSDSKSGQDDKASLDKAPSADEKDGEALVDKVSEEEPLVDKTPTKDSSELESSPQAQPIVYKLVDEQANIGREDQLVTAKFLDTMPENIDSIEVQALKDDEFNREFDISFKDVDGNLVQTTERVQVTMPTGGKPVELVYHLVDGVVESIDFVEEVGHVKFVADSFSVYGMKFAQVRPGNLTSSASPSSTTTTSQPSPTSQTTNTESQVADSHQVDQSSQQDQAEKTPESKVKTQVAKSSDSSEKLPETGEGVTYLWFNAAATSILAGIGLLPRKKED